MSGLAGIFSNEPEEHVLRRLHAVSTCLAGPNVAPLVYAEPGFGVAVSSATSTRDASAAFAEIATDGRYVLAIEGYVLAIDDIRRRTDSAAADARGDVLLRLFVREGIEALARVNGACALALWDRAARVGYLANCMFGRRELFLAQGPGVHAFATEPAALTRLTGHASSLDPRAITESFLCGVTYGEQWPLAGVTRPWPGSLCTVREGRLERRLLDARPADPPEIDERTTESLIDDLDAQLIRSTERLTRVTDDHVVLMSSGTDSPLAASYVRRVTGSLSSMTIGVPFGTDEREGAARLAAVLDSRHASFFYDVERLDLVDAIRRFVRVMQEPVWISTGVALLDVQERWAELPRGIVSGLAADTFFGLLGFEPDARTSGSFLKYVVNPIDARHVRGVVSLGGPHPDRLIAELSTMARVDAAAGFTNVRRLTETASLVRMAMRVARHGGREALFTYLDRDVHDFARRVPVALQNGDKPLLRALWTRVFPAALMVEKKVPFVTHTLHWFYLVNRMEGVLDLLSDRRTRERGMYLPGMLPALVARYRDRSREVDWRWHTVVWQIAVFELYCREFIDAAELPVSA